MSRGSKRFGSIKTEGGLLPQELLSRIQSGDSQIQGINPESYHLIPGERIGETVNRSWNRMLVLWRAFQDSLEKEPETAPATGLTRERWLLPLFQELGYGRLPKGKSIELDNKTLAISHIWQNSPIHLMGCRVDLDRRQAGVAGASQSSPHGLVQELLNRSDGYLWGFVSNGYRLRILRDHHSLTRQAFVEFDLQSIMDGEQYSEFFLLWMICHQSRVDAEKPEECWLETWFKTSRDEGIRALDKLRNGVENAIESLGTGFLKHRANSVLRSALESGELDKQDYYREVLRLVYRIIFLFAADDREMLLDPLANDAARDRYTRFYSTRRLRELADKRRGGPHGDLWQRLRLVMEKLDDGCPGLALPALGSMLWRHEACSRLLDSECSNENLLDAIRFLSHIQEGSTRYSVNWRNVGAEELGSIYESLLELHPRLNKDAGSFELDTAAGHERKTTGSYYTPSSLVDCLLDSALDPVIDAAVTKPDPEKAILELKVCDPAAGSGHFLLAAARRLAKRLAAVRSGDVEPSPAEVQKALRDVVGRCIYGVDINPMAVELCKVSLWMEALEPGKPLSFLDHRIKCGNSLLGATPALIEKGISDGAFEPVEGDDRAACSYWKKENKRLFQVGPELFDIDETPKINLGRIAQEMQQINSMPEDSIDGLRAKEKQYEAFSRSDDYAYSRFVADTWCAAFAVKKVMPQEGSPPILQDVFKRILKKSGDVPEDIVKEVKAQRDQYQWVHWHLEFSDVFRKAGDEKAHPVTGWAGGFDCVLGNPPWERVKLQEKEWFAERSPEIAAAPNAAARKRMIEALAEEDSALFEAFMDARRQQETISSILRESGRYPLCGRGDVNTYTVFAELNRQLINKKGRVGCIVPSGIATDDTTKFFFQDMMDTRSLISLFDFENRKALFPGVHRSYKFCLLTVGGPGSMPDDGASFIFFALDPVEVREGERVFTLTAEDIALINPNTRTCPIFRTKRDADITRDVYRRVPVLVDENREDGNPWGISFMRMFDMANDSYLFLTREELTSEGCSLSGNVFEKEDNGKSVRYLPLYEAKMFQQFDHRAADVIISESALTRQGQSQYLSETEHKDPLRLPQPRFWINSKAVIEKFKGSWDKKWLIGWRDITSPTNERTTIATIIPLSGCGDTILLTLPNRLNTIQSPLLVACWNTFCFDYIARQKLGGIHLKYHVFKQCANFPSNLYYDKCSIQGHKKNRFDFLIRRVLELTFTSFDLTEFSEDYSFLSPPFVWDEERRFVISSEIDAYYFHFYGIEREDVEYIMETFPIVKRKDIAQYDTYRTKDTILEIYDAMQRAIDTEEPYQTPLNPPPGPPTDAEGNFIPMEQWDPDNWPVHIHRPRDWEDN